MTELVKVNLVVSVGGTLKLDWLKSQYVNTKTI